MRHSDINCGSSQVGTIVRYVGSAGASERDARSW